MTSKEIIIKLIDEKKINGEEAYIIINDVLQSEMLETYKALENKKNSDIFKDIYNKPYTTPNTTPTWIGGLSTSSGTYGFDNCIGSSATKTMTNEF